MPNFRYTRIIPFHETDAAGIVHFSRMLCLVEEAEHVALRSLDVPVFSEEGGWPRVKVEIDYLSPLRAGDIAEVQLTIERVGNSSVNWAFLINCSSSDGRAVAKGRMVTVFVDQNGAAQPMGDWRSALECDT